MKYLLITAYIVFLSSTSMLAQCDDEIKIKEDKQSMIAIKLKDHPNAIVYVDGKRFYFPVELIDENKIESVSIFTGKKALEDYNTTESVILIITKIGKDKNHISFTDKETAPLILIDGVTSNKEALKNLSPNDIKEISIYKDETAIKKYNAPNGVIDITTKKGKGKNK